MYCTNCGHEMPDSANSCDRCGTKAGMSRAYCWRCALPLSPADNNCPRCGIAIPPNEAFNAQTSQDPTFQGPPNYAPYTAYSQRKSRVAAGVLGILLGAFGVHNFYLGFTGKALAQLLLSVLSCGALAVVSAIWGLVEGILILTDKSYRDASGQFLAD